MKGLLNIVSNKESKLSQRRREHPSYFNLYKNNLQIKGNLFS
jgi:hypothetical protein